MKADTACSDPLATRRGMTYSTHHLHRRINMSSRVLDRLSFLMGVVTHSTARRMGDVLLFATFAKLLPCCNESGLRRNAPEKMPRITAERHQRKRLPFFAQSESRAKARILRGDFNDSSLRSGNICIISHLVADRDGFEPAVRFVRHMSPETRVNLPQKLAQRKMHRLVAWLCYSPRCAGPRVRLDDESDMTHEVLLLRRLTDSVEEGGCRRRLGRGHVSRRQRRVAFQPTAMGCGIGISFASFRRFWAVESFSSRNRI
jgi:hypothetical protein